MLFRILKFTAPIRRKQVLIVLAAIVGSSIGVAYPMIYRTIIDNGIEKSDTTLVVHRAALIAGLGVVDAVIGLWQAYLTTNAGAEVALALRVKLFEHLQHMPVAFYVRVKAGAIVSRLMSDAAGAQGAFTEFLPMAVSHVTTLSLTIVAVCFLSWRAAVVVIAVLPLFVALSRHWGARMRIATLESCDASEALTGEALEKLNVSGIVATKLLGSTGDDGRRFKRRAVRMAQASTRRGWYGHVFSAGVLVTTACITACVYGWGGALASDHALDLGTIVALVALLGRLYAPISGIPQLEGSATNAIVAFEKIFELLDLAPAVRDRQDTTNIRSGAIHVRFENVYFRYPPAEGVKVASLPTLSEAENFASPAVIQGISFEVEPGKVVAIVGPSGAGKTTIANLVCRLYDVDSGSIQVNGTDVRDAAQEMLRKRIGVVTQECHLFHDTLRANLCYAKPDCSDVEIRNALMGAHILEFVDALPEGLETVVGDRGYRLSGGERQRIAIARVLLRSPDLLILDEATAHLDSATESAVQATLEEIRFGRTAIIIAHRLSTVVRADLIVVLRAGGIAERGTHAELMARRGIYAGLFDRQTQAVPS
ncbi:MAG: transporter related protein [Candidatus Acidoferrum typicum]|nr:transporter related protein [Candidatus Acidoferrum typicum]